MIQEDDPRPGARAYAGRVSFRGYNAELEQAAEAAADAAAGVKRAAPAKAAEVSEADMPAKLGKRREAPVAEERKEKPGGGKKARKAAAAAAAVKTGFQVPPAFDGAAFQ